jgi:DNA-binding response OmpR family regulator
MHVLLLGGYNPLVKALKRGLEEEGFTVALAGADGNGSVPVAYDVIVCDLVRPGQDWAPVQRWRRAGLQTPVLVLAAPNGFVPEAFNTGVDACLTKPFDLETFLVQLRALVGRA